uniref:Uncharacterized protein n=1 Tax=Glossina palpalis gambiensis TaxID=67801 RepID=A0A1B0B221_9MUSC
MSSVNHLAFKILQNQILESYIAPPVSRVYSKIASNSSLNFQYYFIFSIIIIIHPVFVAYEWVVDVFFLNGQNLRTTLHEKKLQPILLYVSCVFK